MLLRYAVGRAMLKREGRRDVTFELEAGKWRAEIAPDEGGNIVGLRLDTADKSAPAGQFRFRNFIIK